ncbi:MAG TPA: type IX secretion system sortase PorU, partial [Bacteroidales bacterium]|nr:type IX secretion system sortase PorU [Bacteroidales bacterium]
MFKGSILRKKTGKGIAICEKVITGNKNVLSTFFLIDSERQTYTPGICFTHVQRTQVISVYYFIDLYMKSYWHNIKFAVAGLVVFMLVPFIVHSQVPSFHKIDWHENITLKNPDGSVKRCFSFANMGVENGYNLPVYVETYRIDNVGASQIPDIQNFRFTPCTPGDVEIISGSGISIEDTIILRRQISGSSLEQYAVLSFLSFRKNPSSGILEKVSEFELKYTKSMANDDRAASHQYTGHSVLAEGSWFKLSFIESGICKLTYNDLVTIGINPSGLDPRNLRIYANGGGMLPESNKAFRYDDLTENAIFVHGEDDGKFDDNDYILFYVSPQTKWKLNSSNQTWEHITNIYSDTTFVFITPGTSPGRRIQTINNSTADATVIVNNFEDYSLHETEQVNLIGSGRRWFGEIFDLTTQYSFNFSFPGLVAGSDAAVRVVAAARSTASSSFSMSCSGQSWQATASPISTYYNSSFASGMNSFQKVPAGSDNLALTVTYNKPLSSSKGWLDYVEVNALRKLSFTPGQFKFRKATIAGMGNIAEYQLGNASANVEIWEITNPVNVSRINAQLSGTTLTFKLAADTVRQFIAFDGSAFISPVKVKTVVNQDLHAIQDPGLIIIAPPLFTQQAVRLASLHGSQDDLSVFVITPEAVYNEFSSGSADVSAIRNFMKMFYDRNKTGQPLPYLLLFGDASYDYKNYHAENTNQVPTFESPESFDPVHSYAYDDYYGFLDDNEGSGSFDMVDIGIGRLPVNTIAEAESMVDKIVEYSQQNETVKGDWRNVITFVADDEDDNEHMSQANQLAAYVTTGSPDFNIDKIFLDSYQQQATPTGNRYPDVNKAITQRIEKGTLILNYTGHGGETGWAHEEVLQLSDINSWDNRDRLPVFVTATCEFSRYDDPERISAGEQVLLNPLGGGISLFTTSRPTFGTPNLSINKSFYKYALPEVGSAHPRMGDIISKAKRESGSDENGRKFLLLGDPALRITTPELKVVTTHFNELPVDASPDTIGALSTVKVAGMITSPGGGKVNDFNGTLTVSVFDKAVEVTTLANDGGNPFTYSLQKNLLYKGNVEVTDGSFTFSFIVPRDISYKFGFGKISYYAQS